MFIAFNSDDLSLPGYLDGAIEDGGAAVVYDVCVDDGIHGHGVGRKLVAAFEVWAAEHGAHEVQGSSMMGAVGFWEKLGYAVAEINEDGYAPFQKPLPSPACVPTV